MSTPSPFEIGRGIGSNLSGAIRGAQERSAIDEILANANASGRQEDIDAAMQSILTRVSPERQQAAATILQQKQARLNQERQMQALQSQGIDPRVADLEPTVQREVIKGHKSDKQKADEGKEQVHSAFNRAKEILDSGYTGFSITGLTPEGRELRSELDTLSEVFISHLIPLLNPKGTISKERFNYIKSLVPNSSDTNAKFRGKLAALKEIFKIEGDGQEKTASRAGTREMRDANGVIYDIPEELYEKALSQGLK